MKNILDWIEEKKQKHEGSEPRTLLAYEPGDAAAEMEQSPDSFLRPKRIDIFGNVIPAETLEDWDVSFRRPDAEGGVQQLVQNTVDGSRPGYGEDTRKEKKKQWYKGRFNKQLDAYDEFQKLTNYTGTDAEFEEWKKKQKGYKKVRPLVRAQHEKVTKYLQKLIPELNASEKYINQEGVSAMVEKKFNIKPRYMTTTYKGVTTRNKVNRFNTKDYPVMKNLDSVETKIDNTLKNMLLEKKPLNSFWYRALIERTGLSDRAVYENLDSSPTYKVIKDQGALALKDRFNKEGPHTFLKEKSFSNQLIEALKMEEGTPRLTGIKNIYTSSPKFKVMEFATREWHRNQGNGAIQFFKNGKPIKWRYGVELPYKDVSFTYNGKNYNANKLSNINLLKKDFPEVYKNQTAINKLSVEEIDDPLKKGKKILMRDLIKRNQVNAYKWEPRRGTFDILHGPKGVKGEPFTNLSFNTRDINQLEMGINQSKILSATEKNSVIKTIHKLAGSGDRQAIIQRQIDLAKDIKSGKIQSYGDMQKQLFKNKDFVKWIRKFPCMKSDGGTPDINCHLKGMRHEKNLLAEGKGSRAMANKFIDGTKLARKGGNLKAVLGVGGILGDVLFEGAYAAYNYTQGMDAADIWKHSWYSFMDPSMWKDGKYVGWVEDAEKQKQYEIRDEDGNVTGIRKNVKRYYDNVDKVEQQLNLFDNITDMETMDARGYDRTKAVANAKKALSDFHTSLGPPGGMERIYKELEYDRPYVDTRLEATDVEKVEDKMAAFEKMKSLGAFPKDKEYADRFDKPTHYKKRYKDFLDFRTTIFDRPTEPSFYLPKGKLHRRVEDPRYKVPYATRGGPKAQSDITGAGIEDWLMSQAEQAGEPITRDEAIKLKWNLIYEGGGLDLQDKIGIAGGVANMADGGLTRTVAPDSGPMSQGLRSLYINDKDY